MKTLLKRALHQVNRLKKKRLERDAALKAQHQQKSVRRSKKDEAHHEHQFVSRTVKALFLIVLFAFSAYIIFLGKGVLFMFIVAFLIASSLDPLATKLHKKKIPKGVTVLGVYVLFFVFLILFGTRIVPLISSQLIDIAGKIGSFFSTFQEYDATQFPLEFMRPTIIEFQSSLQLGNIQAKLQEWLSVLAVELFKLKDNVWVIFKAVSSGLLKFLLVLLISYLMILERDSLNNFLTNIIPAKYSKYTMKNIEGVREKMGSWLFGRFLLSVGVGFLTYIVLLILGIPSAATLGIMMGIFDIVPIIGPAVAWLFILPVAANISFFTVVWMSVGVLAVQWFENNLMIPYIMKKTMGIPSLTIVFALIIGAEFFGIVGMILAVPVAAMVALFWDDYVLSH